MSKILKTAAVVVGVAALVVSIPGVGAAIGSALGVSASTVVAATTIAAGALSLAAALTAKKPKAEEYQRAGSPDTFVFDPNPPGLAAGRLWA